MSDAKNSTTKKILRSQRRVLNWSRRIADLLALALVLGIWLVLHLASYAGSLEALPGTSFSQVWLSAERTANGLRFWLLLQAWDMEAVRLDVTQELVVLLVGLLMFWILQRIACGGLQSIGRSRAKAHMQQMSLLAQEARQLGEEAVKRQTQPAAPRVDVLEEAIDHISPTQPARLHIGDPDLKGLEDAVNDLLDRMQAAYSQQTRFVSDASHELRTPIAVLKGYADLLERWGKDDPQVRDEAIDAIQAEAERMNRLVEQLLFLARGDSGRTQLRPEDLDLAELCGEVFEEFRMIDPDHRWVLDAPSPVPAGYAQAGHARADGQRPQVHPRRQVHHPAGLCQPGRQTLPGRPGRGNRHQDRGPAPCVRPVLPVRSGPNPPERRRGSGIVHCRLDCHLPRRPHRGVQLGGRGQPVHDHSVTPGRNHGSNRDGYAAGQGPARSAAAGAAVAVRRDPGLFYDEYRRPREAKSAD